MGIALTPFYIILNCLAYRDVRFLPEVPLEMRGPTLTPIFSKQLDEFRTRIVSRLQKGHDSVVIAEHVASLSGLRADQVLMYVEEVKRSNFVPGLLKSRLDESRES